MLRIGQFGLARIHPKKRSIKHLRVFQNGSRFDVIGFAMGSTGGGVGQFRVGEEGHSLHALTQVIPKLVEVSRFGKASRHANDCDARWVFHAVVHTAAV